MDFWTQIHFAALSLQIAVAIVGGGLGLTWIRARDRRIEINPDRVRLVKNFSVALLWILAIGFILELWYETHLLQMG